MQIRSKKFELIGKDVVSFELAEKLKKIGFKQEKIGFIYDEEKNLKYVEKDADYYICDIRIEKEPECFYAPTLSELIEILLFYKISISETYKQSKFEGMADKIADEIIELQKVKTNLFKK